MTPAIECAKRANVSYTIHQYLHDPAASSYGEEAADKLQLDHRRVFKTLVVALDGKTLAVAVVPVCCQLSLKSMAAATGGKKAAMANPADVERTTGYVLGGVSPLGQKKALRTVIDTSATTFKTVFVSAGRRGVEIELAPQALAQLTGASFASIAAGD